MRKAGAVAALAVLAVLAAGCAACRSTELNPVWSPDVPAEDFVWSETVNVFPFYSKNTTSFADRIEETGNALLFISWSKVTPKAEPVVAVETEILLPAEPVGGPVEGAESPAAEAK